MSAAYEPLGDPSVSPLLALGQALVLTSERLLFLQSPQTGWHGGRLRGGFRIWGARSGLKTLQTSAGRTWPSRLPWCGVARASSPEGSLELQQNPRQLALAGTCGCVFAQPARELGSDTRRFRRTCRAPNGNSQKPKKAKANPELPPCPGAVAAARLLCDPEFRVKTGLGLGFRD